MATKIHDSVWDALESEPGEAENMKFRSALMALLQREIQVRGLTQAQAAQLLRVNQPRISNLMQGRINEFRADALIEYCGRLHLPVSDFLPDLELAAA